MTKKKPTKGESPLQNIDVGRNDAAKGTTNGMGNDAGGSDPPSTKNDAAEGSNKKTSHDRSVAKPKAKKDQPAKPVNEKVARNQGSRKAVANDQPPSGIQTDQQNRGSSRKPSPSSAATENVPGLDDLNTVMEQDGGRSEIGRSASPTSKKTGTKVGTQTDLLNQVDPEHETPVPGSPKNTGDRRTTETGSENSVPPPLIPGEIDPLIAVQRHTVTVVRNDRKVHHGVSLLTDLDIHLFKEGKHFSLYNKLGAHRMEHRGMEGTLFAVWAPNAEEVSVMGDFNGWDRSSHPLQVRGDDSGIWEGFVPHVA
ncbi:MAG: hypothetical protein M3R08_00055, partial [Bacteroidota bacterium]|nr:hypothetical protein [Bacteroidota bacterium]